MVASGTVAGLGGCAGTSFCGGNMFRRRVTVRTVGRVFIRCGVPFAKFVTRGV